MSIKNEIEIHHTRAQKQGDGIDSKSPEGTRRLGPPFPIKSHTRSQQSINQIYPKEKNGGERHMGGGLEEQRIHGQITKAAINLTQVKGYLYPRDRSDRYAGPVRPVG